MSFLSDMFNSNKNKLTEVENSIEWIELNDLSQLSELKEISNKKMALIFKHSTRCGISRSIMRKFEAKTPMFENVCFYYLDLLNHRELSNKIAEDFQVRHQSPQLILVKNENAIGDFSHFDIISSFNLSDYN